MTTWSILSTSLQILGSLGIFLFGMKILSESVQKVAGDRMRGALAGMTGNRVRGIATGFFTTTLVQSSSASTVLVVSFVNAGLLTLIQSIGVIMGANLGTTTTAWIVALVGKFQVAAIALPIIGIGLPLIFIGKDRARSWGEMFIGFGLVFFGLGLLRDSVPDLRTMIETDPEAAEMFGQVIGSLTGHGFASVLLFLAVGAVLTVMVQSSSAAMAITITCALNGWLGDVETDAIGVFRNSAAIVLGENIGTTITAWIASLGASTNAKRAARAHFLFNVIGVVWCLGVFVLFTSLVWWVVDYLPSALRSADTGLAQSEIAFATAIFHTTFNLVNILLLAWFVPQIGRIVCWWVKDRTGHETTKLKYIAAPLVDIGELSLPEAEEALHRLAGVTSEMYEGLIEVMGRPREDLSARVAGLMQMEDTADEMLHDITSYLIQCSTHDIGPANAQRITVIMRAASEFEEATDHIYRLVKILERNYNKEREFSTDQQAELGDMASQVRLLLDLACASLDADGAKKLEQALEIENHVVKLRKRHRKNAARRMKEGSVVKAEMTFIDMNNHFEAIARHARNTVQADSLEGLA